MNNLFLLATAASADSKGLLETLGVDLPTLMFQIVAFLLLVFVLGKWVYPIFIGIIDKRQSEIDAGLKAAHEAQSQAANAESEVAELLRDARAEAGQIIAVAKEEAQSMVTRAEQKAEAKAQAIVAAAEEQLDKDIRAAKKALHNETIDLVAAATEKIIGATVTPTIDEAVIKQSLKEAQR